MLFTSIDIASRPLFYFSLFCGQYSLLKCKSLVLNVSSHVALTKSTTALLNRPKNVVEEERSGHVIHIFQNVPGTLRGFKSPGQGAGPGPS